MTLMDVALTLDLPFEVFSNFEVLELKNYDFKTTPYSNPQQVLKTLTLNKVHIITNNFQDILSPCSCLENLTLENCNFFRNGVNIVCPSLKYIKICNMNERRIWVSPVNVEYSSRLTPLFVVMKTWFLRLQNFMFYVPTMMLRGLVKIFF
jgi:hypothetical protein